MKWSDLWQRRALAPHPNQEQISDLSAGLQDTALFFSTFTMLGLLCVWIHAGWVRSAATPLMWAFACLAAGTAVGFLFGIPKILQGDVAAGGSATNTALGTTAPAAASQSPYRQRVNTNLEEISDWLTKIIVGLGLVNLAKIPPKLQSLADVLAGELHHPPSQRAFALALIVYFVIDGFLYGYLFTRLYLQRAFAQADLSAIKASELNQKVESFAKRALEADPKAGEKPTEDQIRAAEQVAKVAAQSNPSIVEQQINSLAQEYETVRASMPPSDERTRRMEICVTKMRTLAIAAQRLLPQLMSSSSPGQRLAAMAILQIRPDPAYIDWLADRLGQEKPFVGYHAAVALLTAARTLDTRHRSHLADAIRKAKAAAVQAGSDSGQLKVLAQAESELHQGGGNQTGTVDLSQQDH